MEKLTTLAGLQGSANRTFVFPETCVTQEQVKQFGELTGDWNDHNSNPTQQFERAAVQGFLSLSLFAGFHKSACLIESADPINVQVLEAKFIRPIYTGQLFVPSLGIESVDRQDKFVKAIWLYNLWGAKNSPLVFARIELRYYFTT